jgi:hypothetical protein
MEGSKWRFTHDLLLQVDSRMIDSGRLTNCRFTHDRLMHGKLTLEV